MTTEAPVFTTSVISGVLPIAFVSAVLWDPPLATTLVLVSTAKVQSFPALSVTVRLSAATDFTVPLAVFVESAAKAGDTSTSPRTSSDANMRVMRTPSRRNEDE